MGKRFWVPTLHRSLCIIVAVLSFFSHPISCSQRKAPDVCVSPGGRFPPFKSDGRPPKKAERGPRALTFCRVFRENTCCDVAQTSLAFASIRRLASSGEASQDCLDLWEALECSICHPIVGTMPGLPLICASFCDKVFSTCSNAYFSIDGQTQILSPCGLNNVMCGRARGWVSNGTELCLLAGFAVQPADPSGNEAEESFCYGSKASLEAGKGFWKDPRRRSKPKFSDLADEKDFFLWVRSMNIKEMLSWAAALGACLFLMMRKKRVNYRQRQAAVQKAAKILSSRNLQG
ncbi:folate receptor family protein [Wolffia australiana]